MLVFFDHTIHIFGYEVNTFPQWVGGLAKFLNRLFHIFNIIFTIPSESSFWNIILKRFLLRLRSFNSSSFLFTSSSSNILHFDATTSVVIIFSIGFFLLFLSSELGHCLSSKLTFRINIIHIDSAIDVIILLLNKVLRVFVFFLIFDNIRVLSWSLWLLLLLFLRFLTASFSLSSFSLSSLFGFLLCSFFLFLLLSKSFFFHGFLFSSSFLFLELFCFSLSPGFFFSSSIIFFFLG
mmetsp:Transcript_5167/g.4950  ORF Transcript_5167/g.4950 Transcript_5167/m.4950 type:complete len:236 (-) Transcript_5167:403-1110(-)